MADNEQDGGEATPKTDGQRMVETITDLSKQLKEQGEAMGEMKEVLEKAKETQYPHGQPGSGVHGVRVGESPLSSRPYSLMRLATALRNPSEGRENAKIELDLGQRLAKATKPLGYNPTGVLIPFSADHMPTEETEIVKDEESGASEMIPGYPSALVGECRQIMKLGVADPDELKWLAKRLPVEIRKDLSAQIATLGGTLVGAPSQGQLIDLLRPQEFFSSVGAQEISLPPQGSIRFPRDNSDPTVAAFSEGQTITESTPTTGELLLQAKKYAALVDIPVELFNFGTSVNVESWLRNKFVRRIALQTDADMISGGGGARMQGIINFANIQVFIASTVGAQGDTLGPDDPSRLFAQIADADARVDNGFFYGMRPQLWQRLTHRRAGSGFAADDGTGAYLFQTAHESDAAIPRRLEGEGVIISTQIPQNRAKGAATDLTLVLAGVGPSWIIARAGVAEMEMTNSDASKFAQGVNTMRAMLFMDAGPEHPEEFGIIDTVLETT